MYIEGFNPQIWPPIDDQADFMLSSMACIASGLAYLHSKRIRHEDLNLDNILFHCTITYHHI